MRIIALTLVVLAFCSCGREKPPISKSQMVNILVDVHVAEALISGYHPVSLKDSLEPRYLKQVLDKWEVSETDFEAALQHMNGDPAYLTDILQTSLERVGEMSDDLDKSDTKKKNRSQSPTQQGKGSIAN